MRFELFVATRYLRAKRRQAFIGIITAISIAGVAAGVASLIIALAINNGFRQDLQQRLLGSTAHVSLLRVESDGIRDWRPLLEKLSTQPHVVAAAPAIYEQVLISRGPRARGAVLKGMLPQYERKVSDLLKTVSVGSAQALDEPSTVAPAPPPAVRAGTPPADGSDESMGPTPATSNSKAADKPAPSEAEGSVRPTPAESPDDLASVQQRQAAMPPIILGKDMAEQIGATVGSVVLVTSPQGELTPFGMVPKYIRFRVAGIFNSGFFDYDSSWAFTRLSDAQQLFGLGDLISVLEFKLDDIYQANPVARQLEQAADLISGRHGFMATSWSDQNKALFRALRLERVVTFITIGLIVFVAALNILISLIMMVMEKTKDIAVLMSLGTKKAQIRRIFIAQGVLIGVLGTAIGLVLGYALSWAGGHYHFISLSPEVYSIDYVPFAPRATDGVIVALVSIGISFVATIYPSWSAARILPAEALRYE
ncbi:MAG: FtsX-like permease family protein [Acidobacteriia bacterium]|nr:FtsX-like permease family protein [Terriglobia bacterium]